VRKVKGGATGCGNVMSLQPSKQHALCEEACNMEEHVFIVKTFY